MKSFDLLEEVYFGLSSNKARSGLTMLGIIIGIGSVIAMMAVGQGTQTQIEANIQSIGSNLLLIMPGNTQGVGVSVSAGRGSAQTLINEDADAVALIPNVKSVAPEMSRRFQLIARGKNTNTQVVGTTPTYLEVRNVAIGSGSFFTSEQVQSRAKLVVIGPTVRDDLFGTGSNPVGERLTINGLSFVVIGVTKAKGGTGFTNQDDMVFVPLSSMQMFLAGGQYLTTISVEAADQAAMASIQTSVTDLLLSRHHIANPANADFSVLNQADIVNAASSVAGTFTALLASIASISLLVGGIGIMNMMLTTVTERTHEIGLRLAIGAHTWEIVGQFLGEAVMLTLIGGFLGILLGYGASILISSLANTPTTVAWSSVILAFGVSAVIGLIFGFYPALRASQLNPIEALRYE